LGGDILRPAVHAVKIILHIVCLLPMLKPSYHAFPPASTVQTHFSPVEAGKNAAFPRFSAFFEFDKILCLIYGTTTISCISALDFPPQGGYTMEGLRKGRRLHHGNCRASKPHAAGLPWEGCLHSVLCRVQPPLPLLPQRRPGAAGAFPAAPHGGIPFGLPPE